MSSQVTVPFHTAATTLRLTGRIVVPPIAACVGAALIAAATGDLAPLAAVWPLVVVGLLLSWTLGLGRVSETLAGWSMFGVCLLAAGISHVYQHARFGSVLTSTSEVSLWYGLSKDGFAYALPSVNAPFAANTWRAAYELAAFLGLGNGIWIAIIVNTLVMAAAATLVVRTASILFPGDERRVGLVAALVLACPMFWLFGGMLVRDSFGLLIQAATVLVIVDLLSKPVTVGRVLTHAVLLAALMRLTIGIRAEMFYTYPVAVAIAAVGVILQGRGLRLLPLVACSLAVGVLAFLSWNQITTVLFSSQAAYLNTMTNFDFGSSGLGNRLVVSQPLPIRAITGTLYMHLFPIPVWTGFSLSNWEYLWLKSFSALFIIAITPLAVTGCWRSMSASISGQAGSAPGFFLVLYWPLMVAAVAVTSLETRHVGQFIPVLILLAAIPNLKESSDWRLFRSLAALWYGAVVAGHVAWLVVT